MEIPKSNTIDEYIKSHKVYCTDPPARDLYGHATSSYVKFFYPDVVDIAQYDAKIKYEEITPQYWDEFYKPLYEKFIHDFFKELSHRSFIKIDSQIPDESYSSSPYYDFDVDAHAGIKCYFDKRSMLYRIDTKYFLNTAIAYEFLRSARKFVDFKIIEKSNLNVDTGRDIKIIQCIDKAINVFDSWAVDRNIFIKKNRIEIEKGNQDLTPLYTSNHFPFRHAKDFSLIQINGSDYKLRYPFNEFMGFLFNHWTSERSGSEKFFNGNSEIRRFREKQKEKNTDIAEGDLLPVKETFSKIFKTFLGPRYQVFYSHILLCRKKGSSYYCINPKISSKPPLD